MKHGLKIDEALEGVKFDMKSGAKRRTFIRRNKYKRLKRRKASKLITLVHNFSDFELTADMESVLNKGLGFVVTPYHINKTELMKQIDRWKRSLRWKEHHFDRDTNNNSDPSDADESGIPNIFRHEKTNLPREAPSQLLAMYMAAVESELLASCNRRNSRTNLTLGEQKALEDLKLAQRD